MYQNASALNIDQQQQQQQAGDVSNGATNAAIERADTLEKNPVFVDPNSLDDSSNGEMIAVAAGTNQEQQQIVSSSSTFASMIKLFHHFVILQIKLENAKQQVYFDQSNGQHYVTVIQDVGTVANGESDFATWDLTNAALHQNSEQAGPSTSAGTTTTVVVTSGPGAASDLASSPTCEKPSSDKWPGELGFQLFFQPLPQNAKNKSWDVSFIGFLQFKALMFQ